MERQRTELEEFVLAYMDDPEVKEAGNIMAASVVAERIDTQATNDFAHSYLVSEGLLKSPIDLGTLPDTPPEESGEFGFVSDEVPL